MTPASTAWMARIRRSFDPGVSMSRATSILSRLLVLGALAWLVKVSLIAANGGTNTNEGAVAVFFAIGALGLLLGSSSLGLWLARRRPLVIAIVAGVASIAVFWLTFGLIDEALQSIVGDAGPVWFDEEAGIVVTALIWLAIGIALVRRTRSVDAPVASGDVAS